MLAFRPLQRYFDFRGRSGRAEYWQWILLTTVAGWIARALDAAASSPYVSHGNTAVAALALGTFIPNVSAATRRLHDRNLPGGWLYGGFLAATLLVVLMLLAGKYLEEQSGSDVLLGFGVLLGVPWVGGAIYLIVQLAMPGNAGANTYGEPDAYVPTAAATDLTEKLLAPLARRPTDPPTGDPFAMIERLAQLRDQGVLTEAEFDQQKAALLANLQR